MDFLKSAALFSAGGSTYVGLELAYRGRSHVSMFAAGGLCFLLLGRLRKAKLPVSAKAALGTLTITAVELITGLLVNRNYAVWDYRHQPYNFLGQVCPLFMALWLPLSLIAMGLYGWLDKLWDKAAGRTS